MSPQLSWLHLASEPRWVAWLSLHRAAIVDLFSCPSVMGADNAALRLAKSLCAAILVSSSVLWLSELVVLAEWNVGNVRCWSW